MSFVVDASVAAAWVLPDEASDTTDILLRRVAAHGAIAPGLLWHELRNILLTASRRNRLPEREVVPALLRMRRLPIESVDTVAAGDAELIVLARQHELTAYDAAYLALARGRGMMLATADGALRRAAEAEGVELA